MSAESDGGVSSDALTQVEPIPEGKEEDTSTSESTALALAPVPSIIKSTKGDSDHHEVNERRVWSKEEDDAIRTLVSK